MDARTRATAEQAVGSTLRHFREAHRDTPSHEGILTWLNVLEQQSQFVPWKTAQALRTWLTAHDGETIATMQARVDVMSQEVRQIWEPGDRRIEAKGSYANFWEIDDPQAHSFSRREYAGVYVLYSDSEQLVAYSPSFHQVILYRVID